MPEPFKLIAILFAITLTSALGQDTERIAPSQPVPPLVLPASDSQPEESSSQEESQNTLTLLPELKAVIVASDPDSIIYRPKPVNGFIKKDEKLIIPEEAEKTILSQIGEPLSFKSLQRLARQLVLDYRAGGVPVVDVSIPEQDITDGVLQLIVVIGAVAEVRVKGAEYFDESIYLDAMTLRRGDVIRSAPIVEDLRFLNRNPYRTVNLVFGPGEDFGETDILLRTEEERPWNVFAGYKDTGNNFIGRDRVLAGFQTGNLFGAGHILSYQYNSTPEFERIHAHVATYQIPISNRYEFRFLAAYVDTEGFSEVLDESLRIGGESVQLSPSLLIPLKSFGNVVHEMVIGADFKSTNNNLEFGGIDVFDQTTEIYQLSVSHLAELRSKLGYTRLSNSVFYAPGELSSHNDDAVFSDNRFEASADYLYWKGSVAHYIPLPKKFTLGIEVEGQISSQNLLPSEQLLLAGIDTVRGFEQNLVRADQGVVANVELYTPPFKIAQHFLKPRSAPTTALDFAKNPVVEPSPAEPPIDSGRFFGFFDYGWGRNVNLLEGEGDFNLAAAGLGVDYRFGKAFTARLAYAWQLGESGFDDDESGRWHISTLVRY